MTLTEKVAELRKVSLSSAPPSEHGTVNLLFDWLHDFTTEYESIAATLPRIEAALQRIEEAVTKPLTVEYPKIDTRDVSSEFAIARPAPVVLNVEIGTIKGIDPPGEPG